MTDDPAEEAWPDLGADSGRRQPDQLLDDRVRLAAMLGCRAGEGRQHRGIIGRRRAIRRRDVPPVSDRGARRAIQRRSAAVVRHLALAPRHRSAWA